MKNLLAFTFLLFAFVSNAQSEKVEQYCEVLGMSGVFSSKVTINIDYGDAKSVWKDNRVKNEDGSVKKFNSMIDALNYMGSEGWILVNAFPVTSGNQNVYHYVFKKEFDKKDTQQ
ncbi:MAG: hypothetical protein RL108_108 [Bacteroidota bacterium]|jgi:hypothetical protein